MAYTEVAKVLGAQDSYRLSPEIKRYSLRDVGFVETKGGKFQLERSLDPNTPFGQAFKLKVVVDASLKKFKLATVTANGLKEVNVFTGKNAEVNVEQLNLILADLVAHNILVKL